MTNPYMPRIKTPTVPGSMSTGPSVLGVKVVSVAPHARPPVAVAVPPDGRQIQVRIDLQRGRGSIPRAGEKWIIDQHLGVWSFVAIQNADPTGSASAGDLSSVAGLSDALNAHDDALATHDARLDTLLAQGTVVAANGTTADVQLLDGTVQSGVATVSNYTPTVGDTVWTAAVDAAGSRVALGTNGSGSSSMTAANWHATFDSQKQSIFTTGTGGSGIRSAGATLQVVPGSNPTQPYWTLGPDSVNNPALLAPTSGTYGGAGIVATSGTLYAVSADNTLNHAPLAAKTVTVDAGSGSFFGPSSGGGGAPGIFMPGPDVGLAGYAKGTATAPTLNICNSANTAYANLACYDLHGNNIYGAGIQASALSSTGAFSVAGQTTFNGGVIGTQGASLRGSTLQCDLLLCSPPGPTPTPNQIITYDLTATHNIACNGTIYGTVAPSERSLKNHIENLGDPWGFLERLVPARFTWLDTEHFDADQHVGIYVDEMDEADPDTVLEMPEMPRGTFGVDEETGEPYSDLADRHNRNRGRYPDERALLAYAVRALQDAHERIKALEAVTGRDSAPKG